MITKNTKEHYPHTYSIRRSPNRKSNSSVPSYYLPPNIIRYQHGNYDRNSVEQK